MKTWIRMESKERTPLIRGASVAIYLILFTLFVAF
jgi:hypothetical protein